MLQCLLILLGATMNEIEAASLFGLHWTAAVSNV